MTTLNIPDEWGAEVLGFADMNTYVRDNMVTIDSAISLTNTGYGCGLSTTGSQNISNNTWTALTFGAGAELWDDGAMHSPTTNSSRITIVEAGRYQVNGELLYTSSNGAGGRYCSIYKNGAAVSYGSSIYPGHSTENSEYLTLSCVLDLAADDYIELYTKTTTTTATTAVGHRRFTAYRLKNDGT